MRFVVHVGSVKTGSTCLQRFLYENRSALEGYGVLYPKASLSSEHDPDAHKGNGILLRRGANGRDLDAIVRGSDAEYVVFSDEGLFSDFRYIVKDHFQNRDFLVLAYIRDPVELISSWASELCKPYNIDYDGIIDLSSVISLATDRYENMLNGFVDSASAVGWNRVVVHPYHKDILVNGDILDDFFSIIGQNYLSLDNDINREPYNYINRSRTHKYCQISIKTYEKLRKIDRLDLYHAEFVDQVYRNCRTGYDAALVNALSHSQIHSIYDKFENIYNNIYKMSGQPHFACLLEKERQNETAMAAEGSDVDELEIDTMILKRIIVDDLLPTNNPLPTDIIDSTDTILSMIDLKIDTLTHKMTALMNQRDELALMQNILINNFGT